VLSILPSELHPSPSFGTKVWWHLHVGYTHQTSVLSLVVSPFWNHSPNFNTKIWWGIHIGSPHQTSMSKFGENSMYYPFTKLQCHSLVRSPPRNLLFYFHFLKFHQHCLIFWIVFLQISPEKKNGSCDCRHPKQFPSALFLRPDIIYPILELECRQLYWFYHSVFWQIFIQKWNNVFFHVNDLCVLKEIWSFLKKYFLKIHMKWIIINSVQ
jgi:hypothetical protein